MKPFPQPILLRLSDVSDVAANTAHRSAYVTTTLPALVQGLRNLECQPDPFNEFQGPDALFSRLLAVLAGTTEYDAVMGNEVERLNALYAEQVEKNAQFWRGEWCDAGLTPQQMWDEIQQIRTLISDDGTHGGPAQVLARKLEAQADEIATLRRERDEALADVESLRTALSKSSDNLLDAMTDIGRLHQQITTPTPGAQA